MWVIIQKSWDYRVCKKCDLWNPTRCTCENGKYFRSIIDHSVVTCDEIINAVAKS